MSRHEPPAGFIALIRQFQQFAAERDGEVVLADEDGKVEGFFPSYPQALAAGYAKFNLAQFWVVDINASTVASWARWLAQHDDVEAEYGSWDNRPVLALHAPVQPDGEGYPFSWIEPRLREIGHDDIADAVRQMRASWRMAQESEEFHKGKRIEAEAALAALATPSQAPAPIPIYECASALLNPTEFSQDRRRLLAKRVQDFATAIDASRYNEDADPEFYRREMLAPSPSQAVASALQAPEGWKLVPIEPTEEMHVAAVRTAIRCSGNADFPPRVYRAMLAAAPAHPVVQPGAGGSAPAPVPAGDAWTLASKLGRVDRFPFRMSGTMKTHNVECVVLERSDVEQLAAALSKQVPAGDAVALTDEQIRAGWHKTFSTNNPFCPCDLKTFTKAVRWAERALSREGQADSTGGTTT